MVILAILCATSCGASGSNSALPQVASLWAREQGTSVPDGFEPSSELVALNGRLYGTTSVGGVNNQGTVFRITTSGEENVVYSFAVGCQRRKKCSDGLNPTALVRVNGKLYGSTGGGGLGPCINSYGPNGCGTVFSLTTSGVETVLYSFGSRCHHLSRCGDAIYPQGLTDVYGSLYGTSWYGGKHGLGTVYTVTTGGVEKVLHSFGPQCGTYCRYPNGGLIDLNGTLYGTTLFGGAQGVGFVFAMSERGRMKVLYSFDTPKYGDSAGANGSLIDVDGVLYGTTSGGGAYGLGTAFGITTGGTLNVLHSFGAGCSPNKRCSDGEYPVGGLLNFNGVLYGVTDGGGTGKSGTVFSITTSGNEEVLHSFSRGVSGGSPAQGLTELHGILYGITVNGGPCQGGTVYRITLNGKFKVLHNFC